MIKKLLNFLFGIGRMPMNDCLRIVSEISTALQDNNVCSLHVSIYPHCFSDNFGFDAVGGVLGTVGFPHHVEITIRYDMPALEVYMRGNTKRFTLGNRTIRNSKTAWVEKAVHEDNIKAIVKYIETEFLKD